MPQHLGRFDGSPLICPLEMLHVMGELKFWSDRCNISHSFIITFKSAPSLHLGSIAHFPDVGQGKCGS